MRKICFITGTRADYGLIKPIIDEVKTRSGLALQLIVTGAHLSPEHGNTVEEISENIDAKIEMLEHGDSATSVIKSMGRELNGLATELENLKPDLMVIAGDRYEMLAAASACLVSRTPIAHIYGGDVTEGAFDDSIRHAITKMSILHFVSNEDSRRRVIQMGERPETVFNTGSPSLDKLAGFKPLSRAELEDGLKIQFRKTNLLVTFHPETLAEQSVEHQVEEFVAALEQLDNSHSVIITMPNADPAGNAIRHALEQYAAGRDNIYLFESLGYVRYFSLMSHVDMVIGNSSSGLYEVPSFKIPTINIGNRQKGRLLAESVINCKCTKAEISNAITKARTLDCSNAKNPYGSGNASKQIVDVIEHTELNTIKKFHDIYNS